MADTVKTLKSGVVQTLSGTVVRLVADTEENEIDSFILKDATGEVLVDAEELNLTVGDPLTVVGELKTDEEEGETAFEALKITKADGKVILNPFGTAGAASTDDILDGTNRRDTFDGGAGRDFLNGRGGKDDLLGGAGGDILIGGRGKDVLTGGAGKDVFAYETVIEGGDRITDFNVRQDAIDLDDVFGDDIADIKGNSLDQFADVLKLTQVGANTVVRVDINGASGSASFKDLVTLEGVNAANLSARNFIFD
jgi:Ca2+-binding RTX toxin-like protein